jgi:hypothetical protein
VLAGRACKLILQSFFSLSLFFSFHFRRLNFFRVSAFVWLASSAMRAAILAMTLAVSASDHAVLLRLLEPLVLSIPAANLTLASTR